MMISRGLGCIALSAMFAAATPAGAYPGGTPDFQTGKPAFNWRGEVLDISRSDVTCDEVQEQEPYTGAINTVQGNCYGAAIDECVDGMVTSHPGQSTINNIGGKVGVKVGAKGSAGVPLVAKGEVYGEASAEVSGSRTWSRTWGGGSGIGANCMAAANDAIAEMCQVCP